LWELRAGGLKKKGSNFSQSARLQLKGGLKMRSQKSLDLSRRQFVKRAVFVASALPALNVGALVLSGCGRGEGAFVRASESGNDPNNPVWRIKMVSDDEPGEPLIISGTIYGPDGVKPVEGAKLTVYHTDARGYYSDQDGNGQAPQPRLKGWMKTGIDGRYEFRTIKAAPYPGGGNPAHIHSSLSAPGFPERWIEEYWFEGDYYITAEMRSRLRGSGKFSPILALQKGSDGVWRGYRDLKLETDYRR
jgi:protocatechuate 3,4-dioxygenase beta subunit